jgi:imidazole glycerol-phosphate synthase subunit HisH
MITIIDYGLGNLASVKNMVKKVGGRARITDVIDEIAEAEKLILPGVGAFGMGMKNIKERGLQEAIDHAVLKNKTPMMGICLGAQLLTMGSEESDTEGLGYVPYKTVLFRPTDRKIKVPHMGWNEITFTKPDHPIFAGLSGRQRYYFVHSYYIEQNDTEHLLATCSYDGDFAAGIVSDNVIGFQFHPEKSHKFGMALMKNFVNL